jgi:hypothetical protein
VKAEGRGTDGRSPAVILDVPTVAESATRLRRAWWMVIVVLAKTEAVRRPHGPSRIIRDPALKSSLWDKQDRPGGLAEVAERVVREEADRWRLRPVDGLRARCGEARPGELQRQ